MGAVVYDPQYFIGSSMDFRGVVWVHTRRALVADCVCRKETLVIQKAQIMRIEITVKPQARENKVEKTDTGFKVWTTAPARDGRANEAVIQLLAEYFDTAPSNIKILRGHTSHKKLIEVE